MGCAALIAEYALMVPAPERLCAVSPRHRRGGEGPWRIFTPRYNPEDSLQGHLTFALKYEGIDLFLLNVLFKSIEPRSIVEIVQKQPTGAYSRRIWFLYEWLRGTRLDLDDVQNVGFVPLVNEALQYAGPSRDSRRHRIRNNLPGTREFCPLIRRTEKLDRFTAMNLSGAVMESINRRPAGLIGRAAAFLQLQDSKASYTIEGESPPHSRIERWGRVIGEAGRRALSAQELEYLQSVLIGDERFIRPGYRTDGGFIGDHDRITGMPVPEHVSARHEDLESLIRGLIDTAELLKAGGYNPVLTAALIAFGFVFIHPFQDGNGRIHRYLIHHVLAETGFIPKGLVFPVSAVILKRIDDYRRTLEHYSKPRLDLIQWRPTDKGNVEVLNETIDLYRYFDASGQAEFLFECVEETVNRTLPEEIRYLENYDRLSSFIKSRFDMPDSMAGLLIRFLNQNGGRLSKRALKREFAALREDEVRAVEKQYADIFYS